MEIKHTLKSQLAEDYYACSLQEEDEVVQKLKQDPKLFFSFVRKKQNTKSRVGPFIDPVTKCPNPDPDFCAASLRQQYDSVFS